MGRLTDITTTAEDKSMQRRVWFITENHVPQDPNYDASKFLEGCGLKINAAVWQFELGSKKQHYHVHALIKLRAGTSFNTIKTAFPTASIKYISEGRANVQRVTDYCRKAETRVAGPFYINQEAFTSKQGKRTDREEVVDMIVAGVRPTKIAKTHPHQYEKFHKGLHALHNALSYEDSLKWRDVSVYVYYGDTGTGKTRKVAQDYGYENVYKLDTSSEKLWFDYYQGQKVLLIDEFYGQIPFSKILKLLDGHPELLPVKGGMTAAAWDTVVITSNVDPRMWYPRAQIPAKAKVALWRRLMSVVHFTEDEQIEKDKEKMFDNTDVAE